MKITTIAQATDAGYSFRWQDDQGLWGTTHAAEYGPDSVYDYDGQTYEPETCEEVALIDPTGHIVASRGCIDDATDEYRQELELDLLAEISE